MSSVANYKMVALAREFNGITQTELADKIDISQSALSRMEQGDMPFSVDILHKAANVLGVDISFFNRENLILPMDTFYRKSKVIDVRTKLKVEGIINIYKFLIEDMLKVIGISMEHIVSLTNQPYESATKMGAYLRSYWGIGKGRIDNLIGLLESKGIIVVKVDFGTDKIVGRTVIAQTGNPIIFVNSKLSGDRERLTVAHELGHIVLHASNDLFFAEDEEKEAFALGIEFLMPLSETRHAYNDKLTLAQLADLKRAWKVSMQAIMVRAEREKLVDVKRLKYLWTEVSRAGWRKGEPISVQNETPVLFDQMVSMYQSHKRYNMGELAKSFGLQEKTLSKFLPDHGKPMLRISHVGVV